MSDILLHYGICYYVGKNKISNIQRHFKTFQSINLPPQNKQFYIVFNIDNHNENERNKIAQQIINSSNLPITNFLTDYNWGGTIAALYKLYSHLQNHPIQDSYLAFFEEDFHPINSNWLPHAIIHLRDNQMIGEGTNPSNHPHLCNPKKTSGRWMAAYKCIKLKTPEFWTDGGFYFSTITKFKQINQKIGIFHKGNQNTKYHHGHDGIDIGEVGFPTLLHHNNFKIAGLHRRKYFVHQ